MTSIKLHCDKELADALEAEKQQAIRSAIAAMVPVVFDIARDFEEAWNATDWNKLNDKQKGFATDLALREYDRLTREAGTGEGKI